MKDKIKENLQAANQLVKKGMYNSAMSRLYYGLYQAGMQQLEAVGQEPNALSGKSRWTHDAVQNAAVLMRKKRTDERLFREAYALRTKADYLPTPVEKNEVENIRPKVAAFIAELAK